MIFYALCDANNFFASCERVFNPSLNGRPVVVLSNNDGCIIARSEEAKRLGIKMGEPLFKARETIERHGVAVFSSNYQLYGDMSHRVMNTLKQFASAEIYSIDEAFLNFEGIPLETMQEYGKQIVRTVKRNTGIPVSLGIAPTKTLAKVASKLCKRYPKLEGCCLMYRPEDITKVLSTFPIGDVWGIGRRYSKMLKSHGVETAEQFRRLTPEWVKAKMSIVGLRTWKELHGEACIEFEHKTPDKQSITVSRSFAKELTEIEPLQEAISTFTAMVAEKLRKQHSVAGQMQVYIFTNYHREGSPQHYEGRLVQFLTPTESTLEMVKAASAALKELFRKGYGYKKAGVILYDIKPNTGIQATMFDEIDRPKHKALMQTIDTINAHHGRSTIKVGSEGEVHQNRNHTSPRYTTEWSDILVVKV
ncbi:Error-prone lesion bypass DNA polymerase V (UmuC) [Mucinivorans hirudinis]|uniref:Error-prone lesion bypass DNA polymerase V (UmuC) n=1 Tax=Mucinivorans hirudinis TaxID=1433126 RepID=A0A060R7Q2_9BACT|nr:Error-prone lesion bypass DNA polymerase V (UmuC) [Mucinivorans hirudinis]